MCEILGDIRRLLNRRQLPKALQESALAVLDEKDPPLRITNDDRRHLANRQILLLRQITIALVVGQTKSP